MMVSHAINKFRASRGQKIDFRKIRMSITKTCNYCLGQLKVEQTKINTQARLSKFSDKYPARYPAGYLAGPAGYPAGYPARYQAGYPAGFPARYLAGWQDTRPDVRPGILLISSHVSGWVSGQTYGQISGRVYPAGYPAGDSQVVSLEISRFPAHFFVKNSGKIGKIVFLDSRDQNQILKF